MVVAVVKACREAGTAFVPRGAGTGLSGGATPRDGAVVIECSRLDRIRSVDVENRTAVVEPGVVNLDLTRAVEAFGLFYAPDPSSQLVCTLGGNIAENSGGPHTLKHGTTTNHVLALELVLPDGEVAAVPPEPELMMVGSGAPAVTPAVTPVTPLGGRSVGVMSPLATCVDGRPPSREPALRRPWTVDGEM